MTLGDIYDTLTTYPMWVNDTENEINTDEYWDEDTLWCEQWMNFERKVKNLTVDGMGALVVEI